MADDVTLPGTGSVVATDDVSGTHYQKVKIIDGTAESTAAVPGSATDGLLVNLGSNNDVTVTGSVTASATDLDIRDLSSATDSVTVAQATAGNLNATVVGTVTANLAAGTNNIGDVDVLSIAAGDNNIGNVDIVTVPAPLSTTGGGTEATAHRVTIASDSTGVLSVDDNNSSLTVDQATASSLNAQVVGPTAADAAITGNPVTVGARASTANPTSVSADGDVVNIWANRMGAQVITMAPHVGLNGSPWTLTSTSAQYTTTQTSTALVTVGATTQVVVTSIQIQAYGTTAFTCQVYFGTGAFSRGTTPAVFDGEFAPSATNKPGVVMQGPFMGAADADLRITTNTTGSVTVTVWYYTVG